MEGLTGQGRIGKHQALLKECKRSQEQGGGQDMYGGKEPMLGCLHWSDVDTSVLLGAWSMIPPHQDAPFHMWPLRVDSCLPVTKA